MNWFTSGIRIIRQRYLTSYLVLNLLFYGLIGVGMLIVQARPEIQTDLTNSVKQDLSGPHWSFIVDAYQGGHVVRAAAITFAVNFFIGTLIELNLPSLFIPFSGIVMAIFRALLWGLIFGPGPGGSFHTLRTHWPVMLLEGQGYVLGMLSVYIHGKGLVKPAALGADGRRHGYKRGLRESLRIYPLIGLVLAVSAIYEASEVIFILRK